MVEEVEHTSLPEGILEPPERQPPERQQVLLLCHHRRTAYGANPSWPPADSEAGEHQYVWWFSCAYPYCPFSLAAGCTRFVGRMQTQIKIALMTQVLVRRTDGSVKCSRLAEVTMAAAVTP